MRRPIFRHLNRDSAHRQALLRNLVTSLVEHESIATTYPKAKEAQRLAEAVITLGKKNTNASRRRAHQILYNPHQNVEKVFGPLAARYKDREGGYTRVLRMEPKKKDMAPSAILELVDGSKDARFAMTARTLARCILENEQPTALTLLNVKKVIEFRPNGEEELLKMVERMREQMVQERAVAAANTDRKDKEARA